MPVGSVIVSCRHEPGWTGDVVVVRTMPLADIRKRQIAVATLEPAVHSDAAGRVFVPWSELSQVPPSFMSTHAAAWTTTTLCSGTTNTRFAAADMSPNGRAVAIRTATDAGANTTAVQLRVLSPG